MNEIVHKKTNINYTDNWINTKHMQVIASYLMYLPRLYITCLTLLSKLSERERGRPYCINIQPTPFIKQRVYDQEKKSMQ